MMLLTWFYIAGFALLIGGEVNAVIENAAAQQGDMEATAKGKNPRPLPEVRFLQAVDFLPQEHRGLVLAD